MFDSRRSYAGLYCGKKSTSPRTFYQECPKLPANGCQDLQRAEPAAARAGNMEACTQSGTASSIDTSCKEETKHTTNEDSDTSNTDKQAPADIEMMGTTESTACAEPAEVEHDDQRAVICTSGRSKPYGQPIRSSCSCGVLDVPYQSRRNAQPEAMRFEGNSNSSLLHMRKLKKYGVDDPCVAWLGAVERMHRKPRADKERKQTAVRQVNPKTRGKSSCSPACWERLIQAVLAFGRSRARRSNETLFDPSLPTECYCDMETHRSSGSTPPTAKTVQGKWAALREHLVAGRSTAEVAGSKGLYLLHTTLWPSRSCLCYSPQCYISSVLWRCRWLVDVYDASYVILLAAPLYCWLVDVWARQHPAEIAELRAFANGTEAELLKNQKPSSRLSSPSAVETAVVPFVGVARAFQQVLLSLYMSYRVANNNEWRTLHSASSAVIDPATLFRLSKFPFASMAVCCSPRFVAQSESGHSSLAHHLVEQCSVGQLDVDWTEHLKAVSYHWFSLFRWPDMDAVVSRFQLMDGRQLQQLELDVRAAVARLPVLCGLETVISRMDFYLDHPDMLAMTESHCESTSIRLENALLRMQGCSQTYLRTCVWQRCRSELISLCEQTEMQLCRVWNVPYEALSASKAILARFLRRTCRILRSEGEACEDDIVREVWFRHEGGGVKYLAMMLVDEAGITQPPMPALRALWYSSAKLAALCLAVAHQFTDVNVHDQVEPRSTISIFCQCERSDALRSWLWADQIPAWMESAAQQAGVSARMLALFEKLNDSADSTHGAACMDGAHLPTTEHVMTMSSMETKPADGNSKRPQAAYLSAVQIEEPSSLSNVEESAGTIEAASPRALSSHTPLSPRPSQQAQSAGTVNESSEVSAMLEQQGKQTQQRRNDVQTMGDEPQQPVMSEHSQYMAQLREYAQQAGLEPAALRWFLAQLAAVEQPADDPHVNALRRQQLYNQLIQLMNTKADAAYEGGSCVYSVWTDVKAASTAAETARQQTQHDISRSSAVHDQAVATNDVTAHPLPSNEATDHVSSTSAALCTESASSDALSTVSLLDCLASVSMLEAASCDAAKCTCTASAVSEAMDVSSIAGPVSAEQPSIPQSPHLVFCPAESDVVHLTCSECSRVFRGNNSDDAHSHMTACHNVPNVPLQVTYRKQPTSVSAHTSGAVRRILFSHSIDQHMDSVREHPLSTPVSFFPLTSGVSGPIRSDFDGQSHPVYLSGVVDKLGGDEMRCVQEVRRVVDARVLAASSHTAAVEAAPTDDEQTRKRPRQQDSKAETDQSAFSSDTKPPLHPAPTAGYVGHTIAALPADDAHNPAVLVVGDMKSAKSDMAARHTLDEVSDTNSIDNKGEVSLEAVHQGSEMQGSDFSSRNVNPTSPTPLMSAISSVACLLPSPTRAKRCSAAAQCHWAGSISRWSGSFLFPLHHRSYTAIAAAHRDARCSRYMATLTARAAGRCPSRVSPRPSGTSRGSSSAAIPS